MCETERGLAWDIYNVVYLYFVYIHTTGGFDASSMSIQWKMFKKKEEENFSISKFNSIVVLIISLHIYT